MQIGSCWFDTDNGVLINQLNKEEVRLTQQEFTLLSYLLDHRGQVVSRQQLLELLKLKPTEESQLKQAIYRIRHTLGSEYYALIERVEHEGYLLHNKLNKKSLRVAYPCRIGSGWYQFIAGVLLVLLMIFVTSSSIGINKPPSPVKTLHFSDKSQNNMYINLYADPINLPKFKPLSNMLIDTISQCELTSWKGFALELNGSSFTITAIGKESTLTYNLTRSQLDKMAQNEQWIKTRFNCE